MMDFTRKIYGEHSHDKIFSVLPRGWRWAGVLDLFHPDVRAFDFGDGQIAMAVPE